MSRCASIANGLPFCGHKGEQTNLSLGLRITATILGILATTIALCAILGVPGVGQIGTSSAWTLFSVGVLLVLTATAIKCLKKEAGPGSKEKEAIVNLGLPIEKVSHVLALYQEKHTHDGEPQKSSTFQDKWGAFPKPIWEMIISELTLAREEESLHNLSMINSHFANLMEDKFHKSCQDYWPNKSRQLLYRYNSWAKQHTQLSGGWRMPEASWLIPEAAKENKIQKKDSFITDDAFGPFIATESKLFIANWVKKKTDTLNSYDLKNLELEKALYPISALNKDFLNIDKLHLSGKKLLSIQTNRQSKIEEKDTYVNIWDSESGDFLNEIKIRGHVGCSDIWNNKLIVAIKDNSKKLVLHPRIEIWDIENLTVCTVKKDWQQWNITNIQCVEGKIYSSNFSGGTEVWDMNGQSLGSHNYSGKAVRNPQMLKLIGDYVVITDGHQVEIIEKHTGYTKQFWEIRQENENKKPLLVSVDKNFLIVAHEELTTTAVYDMRTFKQLHALEVVPESLKIVGTLLVMTSKGELMLWNIPTGKCLKTFKHQVEQPKELSVDQNRIVVKGRKAVEVFDIIV